MDSAAEGEMVADAVPPEPTLTVSAVARRMGVAPPTLRTWDRRYGLGPSGHTAGAHRRYTSADVARLLVMRRMTLEGVSPADAAKIAKATPVQGGRLPAAENFGGDPAVSGGTSVFGSGLAQASPGATERFEHDRAATQAEARWGTAPGSPMDDAGDPRLPDGGEAQIDVARIGPPGYSQDADAYSASDLIDARRAIDDEFTGQALDAPWRDDPGSFDGSDLLDVLRDPGDVRGPTGGGRVVALPYGTPQSRGLARAAMALDTFESSRLIRDALRRDGTVATWNNMIMPVLRALGERTQITGDGIDVEHAFSEVVLGCLRSVLTEALPPHPQNTPTVLLACADGDYHSMPLHALAAALAERHVYSRMLGSGLPAHALSASVRRTGPSVVVLFARMPGADAGPTHIMRRQRPAPAVVLAGPGWHGATIPSFARQAGSLEQAIDEVLKAVSA